MLGLTLAPVNGCGVKGVAVRAPDGGRWIFTETKATVGASLVAQIVKKQPANVGDPGSIPGLRRFHGEGNGHPLQYSCLENPMDRGVWWAAVRGESRTRLSD